jgi:hypothetical protein
VPTNSEPALAVADPHLEEVGLAAAGSAAQTETAYLAVPQESVSTLSPQCINGPFGYALRHAALLRATGWQPNGNQLWAIYGNGRQDARE